MFRSSLTRLTYVININDISNADKINGDLHSSAPLYPWHCPEIFYHVRIRLMYALCAGTR